MPCLAATLYLDTFPSTECFSEPLPEKGNTWTTTIQISESTVAAIATTISVTATSTAGLSLSFEERSNAYIEGKSTINLP